MKRYGSRVLSDDSNIALKIPTAAAATIATLALSFAESASVAPMKFAIRVLAAMLIGKGICHVRAVRLATIL